MIRIFYDKLNRFEAWAQLLVEIWSLDIKIGVICLNRTLVSYIQYFSYSPFSLR